VPRLARSLVETGSHVASLAAKAAKAQVVAAYPITPQTAIVELIAEFANSGQMKSQYICVESEHSAMAASIGASASGARTFTATSSHGLAYMHEMLHWASNARSPIVMAVVNRTMGPPWNILADLSDSISQRDTGWIQFYCSTHQEIFDTIIQAYKICENSKVFLPAMVCFEGFILSHTSMPFTIPDQEDIDSFLPSFKPGWKLDVDKPMSHGTIASSDYFMELRYLVQEAMDNARELIPIVDREYSERFGLPYHGGLLEEVACDDSETLIISMGTIGSEAKVAVQKLRDKGHKVGLIRIRSFRPFPIEEVRKACRGVDAVAVIDRAISYGGEGQLFTEMQSALYDVEDRPLALNFIAGIGGRDVTEKDIEAMALHAAKCAREGRVDHRIDWYGLKR
jgi:pyruvate/2-oxoacid:ferredoxin oxidoreductase alpha subunit